MTSRFKWKAVYSLLEIATMSHEQIDELIEKWEEQIQWYKTEARKLEIAKEVLEATRGHKQGEPTETPNAPQIDFSLPTQSNRFSGITMEEAVEQVLREAAPGSIHIKRIAQALVKNGYGNGRKTAKKIYGSVNTTCSRGAQKGIFKRVESGCYAIAE